MNTRKVRSTAKGLVSVTKNELNQLLFWAAVGVKNSKGGAYQDVVETTISELSNGKIKARFIE